jgi:hypothetical protein
MSGRLLLLVGMMALATRLESHAAATPAPSASPTATPDALDPIVNAVNFDRAISVVPAFAALDLAPETVTHPTTPRDLAAALLNGVDKTGAVQHGIALETAPFRMLPIRTDIDAYRDSGLTRFLYNFSFSAATSKASDKSDALQMALGFSAILYESANHDPARDPKLKTRFAEISAAHPPPDVGPDDPLPPEDEGMKKDFQKLAEEFQKRSWAGTIWSAAIAPTWQSDSGKTSDLSSSGFTAWSAFSYGVIDPLKTNAKDPINLQFIAEVRYRQGEHLIDPDDNTRTADQDSFIAAGRLRFGTATFNGFAEGAYIRVWHGLGGDGNGWRGAVGVEKQIATNVWLVVSAGQQFGETGAETNELFAVSSLRFGTADKAQFAPP